MKKIILSIGILFCLLTVHAQNKFNYNYDAAGNRILRKQIVLRKKSDDKITHQDSVTEIVNNIQFSIFPNPTTGTVNIVSDENFLQKNQGTTLYLYDINGRILKEQEYTETKQNIELNEFPAGKYVIQLKSKEGFNSTWNVLKE